MAASAHQDGCRRLVRSYAVIRDAEHRRCSNICSTSLLVLDPYFARASKHLVDTRNNPYFDADKAIITYVDNNYSADKMSDQEFDMCEYMWDPDVVMRRLLSILESESILRTLRQTQAYCTDNECLNDAALPGPGAPAASSDFFLMCIVFGFIALMFALRPRSIQGGSGDNDTKRRDHGTDPHGNPPTPPPTAD